VNCDHFLFSIDAHSEFYFSIQRSLFLEIFTQLLRYYRYDDVSQQRNYPINDIQILL
jgi:hypothetical protein